MRFLVYTLLFLLIPFAGFTQVKQLDSIYNYLHVADTNTAQILERGGYTPPPSVMVAGTDNCSTSALLLAANGTTAYGAGGTINATDPNPPCILSYNNSVWFTYSVTVPGTLVATIKGGTQKGSAIAIYSGTCGAFTAANLLGCGNFSPPNAVGSATATATCLQPGLYYVLVDDGTSGSYSITTAFTNTVSDPGPANNCCANAIDISASLNGSTPIAGTTSLATNDAIFTGGCNTTYNNVWYSFVAQGPNLEVTATGTATPQFNVLAAVAPATDVCTAPGVSILCGTSAAAVNNVTGTPLITGNTYYLSVTNTSTVGLGAFTLTVNNPVPNPAGTDCATATFLCGTNLPYKALGGNTNLWGYQDENGSTGDCIGANGEVHSAWYYFQIASGTTLNLNIASASTNNYDFSIWKLPTASTDSICNHINGTTFVSCNSSPTASISTGFSSTGSGTSNTSGSTINSQLTVATGEVYAMLVNSPPIGGGTYTISTSGTASLTCVNNIILPIELGTFTASQNDKEINLKWSTVSETNNNYFTLERSADGKAFEKLDKVKSLAENGNSKNLLYYTDIDYTPLAGVSYYRLSQTDNNGKTNKLTIVSVTNKDNDGAFIIAPNPNEGTINVTYNCEAATTGLFRLYDSNGALVLEQNVVCTSGTNKTQIDLLDKPNGIYFATFTTNSSFYRSKLLKK